MTDLKTKVALVVDNGLFVYIAQKIASQFGKVYYWTPWVSAFPKSNDLLIGAGLPEIERIRWFWDYIDKVDVFIFPDVYFGDLQEQLRDMGKAVWGGFRGDELELNRNGTKKLLKQLGLPVGNYERVVGLEALREYLKEHEDVYVKVSTVRGDFETFHAPTYSLVEPKLDELESKLGAKKFIEEFIVEDNVEAVVEIGYDGWCIDGEFPSIGIQGYEIKDKGLLAAIKPYDELGEQVKMVNSKLSPILKNYGYRGFFSTELRITKGNVPYLIDPCMRCGSPPSELYQEMIGNLAEVIWAGAHGGLIAPEPVCKFGCEVMIHSSWADEHWQAIDFPESIRQFVKLRNLTRIRDRYYVVPQRVGLAEIGAVVGIGDTLKEAIDHAKENCEKIGGYYIECKLDSIDEAIEQIKAGQKIGINFASKEELDAVADDSD